MKKKLIYLFLALVLCLPLVFTSCGDDLTEEEIATQVFQEGDVALTLSMWLPVPDENMTDTNGDGIVDGFNKDFETRLVAVEKAINTYLLREIQNTRINIVAVSESEYYKALDNKFAEIKTIEASNGTAISIANKYSNKAVLNDDGRYEIYFPGVLDQQLDIFFVGGYDNYIRYINGGKIHALNDFFTVGQSYNGLFKIIRAPFFEATKVNGNYYGIPNNHVYSEKGQYVLVDKELYDAYSNTPWDVTYGLYDLESYIESIGAAGLNNVVPFCAKLTDVPGVIYVNNQYFTAASLSDPSLTPISLIDTKEFAEYSVFYQNLSKQSFVSESVDREKAAVQVYNGNLSDIENRDKYYIIETVPPYANIETAFSSMFAISNHSANYERSMKVLDLLQNKGEFKTLLQYGVEEVDYEISYVNGEKVIVSTNSGYVMDMLYTGNCYRTYPDYGVPMSYWDDIKQLNLKTDLHPYYDVELKLTDELRDSLNSYASLMSGSWEAYWSQCLKYSDVALREEVEDIIDDINATSNRLKMANNSYNRNKRGYDAATTDEDRQFYAEKMAEDQKDIDEYNATLDVLNDKLAPHQAFLDAENLVKENMSSIAAVYENLLASR